FVFRRFDCIIAVNVQIAEMFERFGVSRSRIRLIEPHSVVEQRRDLEFPAPLKAFIESHDPLLLTVGLLERHYDLTMQIDVLEEIRKRWPLAGLVIIGSGSKEKELTEHVASKSYAAHVLVCGDVEHHLTLRAIEECDLFLRTTLYDGDSIAVREALHFGVPVIATANGMRPPGVHLVPVSDASALTNAIINQLTTGQGRSNSGAEEPRTGEPSDKNIAAVVDVYRELIEA
ncbi:MAG TPA: glycosyltransferase, partial [Pyrinomonadaceae bacterium]|nr:glycosyltransferase [Pyrinomonadaceae bacterium]